MPTLDEAGKQSLNLLADALGLDEAQRIVILTEYEKIPEDAPWPPEPDSEIEQAYVNIGKIFFKAMGVN